MKSRFVSAVALSFALSTVAVAPAQAYEAANQFRAPAAQTFSSQDLQRYGMAPADAERAAALQDQGYQVMVLTPEEADAYRAGITDNQWLLLGILAGVIVIAVAVAD
jgi:hypothetical protein